MSYRFDKTTGDLVIEGFEKGIAASPYGGIANLQSVNIATENGEVMSSYARLAQLTSTAISGTLLNDTSTTVRTSTTIQAGVWISVTNSSITGLANGTYYISSSQNSGGVSILGLITPFSNSYAGVALTGLGLTGQATFSLLQTLSNPIAKATEAYYDTSNVQQFRYYILDSQGFIWVYDTATANTTTRLSWFLPSQANVSSWTSSRITSCTYAGLAVLNGWLMIVVGNSIYCKSTVNLGNSPVLFTPGGLAALMSGVSSQNPHYAFVGHQGKMYYCDGNYIGSIFPNTALITGTANIQSYVQYVALSQFVGTIQAVIGGSTPTYGSTTGASGARIPAMFFSDGYSGSSVPTALGGGAVSNAIYYIQYATDGTQTFGVYAANSGGSALDLTTGTVGIQYFNTFYPTASAGNATITFTPQRLNLPFFEISTAIAELGNQILIGTQGNAMYPWDQISALPASILNLPEANVDNILTVNNMGYIFAGNKGNVYITNGSTAALAISIPDYCAGIPGTPSSYIEPVFSWGDSMYLRGRVYLSLLDQTSTKTGNCGGVWSFTPTQNMYIGQDTGLALRQENQNSYGTYNGTASLLIPAGVQTVKSPQYFAAWFSSITSPTYGIDTTSTLPSTTSLIETDLIPTGTFLNKDTFNQIEYKLSSPLNASDAVSIKYRQNSTDAYAALPTLNTESTTGISGYYNVNFEKGQWLQFQITLSSVSSTNSSFCRLKELRLRNK